MCRAMVQGLRAIADAFQARDPHTDASVEEANALMKELQCMKYVVNRKTTSSTAR